MTVPANPKIYHIVHVDRLPSILASDGLLSDAQMSGTQGNGTTIGMGNIKSRRLNENTLDCYPDLYVGGCVPFYYGPRSIMLYMFHMANHPDLTYKGGQQPIVHLVADLYATVQWAESQNKRWAFTLSNAGSRYFEDRNDLNQLSEINWNAVRANGWQNVIEEKQAEFLIEDSFPWGLVEQIGVYDQVRATQVLRAMNHLAKKPTVQIEREWYY